MNEAENRLSFFKRLYELLKEEKELLGKMLLLEKEKSDRLGKDRGFISLDDYNEKLQHLLIKEKEIEDLRLSFLGQLSIAENKDIKSFTELYPFVPLELVKGYKDIEDELSLLVKEIKSVNKSNEVIINDSLKMINYGLSIFRAEKSLEIDYTERDKEGTDYRPIIINTVI